MESNAKIEIFPDPRRADLVRGPQVGSRVTERLLIRFALGLFLICTHAASATDPRPAVLTAVNLVDITSGSCRIALDVEGHVNRVDPAHLGDGRFVFDLAPVAWDGPTRRVRPDCPGVSEYRYSQFSRDPFVTRFVVEVGAGWSCLNEDIPSGILVVCSGPPGPEARGSVARGTTIAIVRGIELTSPVAGLDAQGIVDRSLGYTPRDIVRDGLPHFGAMRDDWIGTPRPHEGLDIYVDTVSVQAVAAGTVIGTGHGPRAGTWAKIDHGNGLVTVYVHVSELSVGSGDEVVRGQRIAAVDGAVGNAVEPQLHFELRLDGRSFDPVPFIFQRASDDLKRRILLDQQKLDALEKERAARVRRSGFQDQ